MRTELSGYELLTPLGRGGAAEVWLARRANEPRVLVAVKRLHRARSRDRRFVDKLVKEARIASALSHPNIARLYELGRMGEDAFLAFEYVHGWDLAKVLDGARRVGASLSAPVIARIGCELGAALDHAHTAIIDGSVGGVIHRDVSPGNVLISAEGNVVLTDFGIARVAAETASTAGGGVLGKVGYLAPEQAAGEAVDAKTDLYALGIVLHECATGQRLFPEGPPRAGLAVAVAAAALGGVRPDLPKPLVDVVCHLLAPRPEDRPASARRVLEQLAALTDSGAREELVALLARLDLAALPQLPDPATEGTRQLTEVTRVDVTAFGSAAAAADQATAPQPTRQHPSAIRRRRWRPAAAVTGAFIAGALVATGARWQLTSHGPERARVEVRGSGAEVFVDGSRRGTTPVVLDLPRKPATLSVEQAGHVPLEVQLDLERDAYVTVDALLAPHDAGAR